MKLLNSFLLIVVFFVSSSFLQTKVEPLKNSPQTASIQINLVNLPGVDNEKTKWEISYELRIISQKEEYQAVKAGKLKQMETEEKIGLLVGKGSFSKNLLSKNENRQFKSNLSLTDEIRERLKNQPASQINLAAAVMDEKTIALVKEQENKSQVFLLYATALVYDAKLKKNIIIPLNRVMPFSNHPDANFEMSLKIEDNGTYSVNLIVPTNTTSGITIKQ
ncbi:MAG TPA: hypothetical protein VGC76_13150 [Pyrinomonadaceae bacterium]|jgi:hypothetical protein